MVKKRPKQTTEGSPILGFWHDITAALLSSDRQLFHIYFRLLFCGEEKEQPELYFTQQLNFSAMLMQTFSFILVEKRGR